MTMMGFLLQIATAGALGYIGYYQYWEFYPYFFLAPLALMLGQWMRRHSSRSSKKKRGFFQSIGDLFSGYFFGLVATAIFLGIGFGLLHILEMRPPEGAGRF